jgi:hypothetical protein
VGGKGEDPIIMQGDVYYAALDPSPKRHRLDAEKSSSRRGTHGISPSVTRHFRGQAAQSLEFDE